MINLLPYYIASFSSYTEVLLSSAISHVLERSPPICEIPLVLISHLEKGGVDTYRKSSTIDGYLSFSQKRGRVDRILLATGIASIISEIVELLLKDRPQDDVAGYVLNALRERKDPSKRKTLSTPRKVRDDSRHLETPASRNVSVVEPPAISTLKTVSILLLGISGSGKTTLVSIMKGKKNPKPKKSMGFRPETLSFDNLTRIKFLDVGGSSRIRGIWNNYYYHAHAIIFVVDSACSSEAYQESVHVAKQTLGHKYLQGKPLLLLCNKKDLAETRPIESIGCDLNLNIVENGLTKIVSTSIHPHKANNNGDPDPVIDESIEWILKKSLDSFVDLNERVEDDTREVELILLKKQEERMRKVLLSSLHKAFGLKGEDVSDVFDTHEEGEDFMAHEIGLETRHCLPQVALDICRLVGYQRFAMMIICSFLTKKKQKVKKSWEEAFEFVKSARAEIGLS